METKKSVLVVNFVFRFLVGVILSYLVIVPTLYVTYRVLGGMEALKNPTVIQDGKGDYPSMTEPFICTSFSNSSQAHCDPATFAVQILIGLLFVMMAPNILLMVPFGWVVYVLVFISAFIIAAATKNSLTL